MFNNNKNFYPTPISVITKMLEPIPRRELREMTILEPSAGKGNIIDYLIDICEVKRTQIYAIEKDPELTYFLQGKNFKVIGDDFLQFSGDYNFDLIVGNPPFDRGAEHIIKMWETLSNGQIISLINAESILNPNTERKRQLVEIIKMNGSYEEIGKVFQDAERTTAVDCIIVRLQKKTKSKFNFTFEQQSAEEKIDFSEETIGNTVALNDQTGALIRCYNKTKEAYLNYLKAVAELQYMSKPIIGSSDNIFGMANAAMKDQKSNEERYNLFITDLKSKAWREILRKLNIEKYLTSEVLKNFEQFAKTQGAMDLTKENIHSLIIMLINNQDKIMKDAIVNVFDLFTKYHKENRVNLEGWVTNESWIVGPKIILPYYIEMGYSGYFSYRSQKWQEFSDIEKVLCYIQGINYDEINQFADKSYSYNTNNRDKECVRLGLKYAIDRVKIGSTNWHESEFFLFKCFKKGTIHLKWKSEELRAKFNMIACDGKFNLGYNPKSTRQSRQRAA